MPDDGSGMDQPSPSAALGAEPIRTIGREELSAKVDRRDDFKLIMALNRWAFEAKHIPTSLHFDTPEALYAAVRPDDEVVVYCSHVDCLSSVALFAISSAAAIGTCGATRAGCSTGRTAGLPLKATSRPRHERPDDQAAAPTARHPHSADIEAERLGWYEVVGHPVAPAGGEPRTRLLPGSRLDGAATSSLISGRPGWLAMSRDVPTSRAQHPRCGVPRRHDIDI